MLRLKEHVSQAVFAKYLIFDHQAMGAGRKTTTWHIIEVFEFNCSQRAVCFSLVVFMQDVPRQVSVETLVLVAMWGKPAIFQGCFKISPIDSHQVPIFLFFRCELENQGGDNHVDDTFSPDEYNFSHLYNECHIIFLEEKDEGVGYAEYILKYALYKTLLEMRTNQKQKFVSIDEEAMKAMIKRVEPMLQREGAWEMSDEHIGFAVAMDFHPQEQMGKLAVKTLINLGASINYN